jgi:hypothetical protein
VLAAVVRNRSGVNAQVHMDKMAGGLLLMAFGVALLLWYYRLERAKRELVFRRLTEGRV